MSLKTLKFLPLFIFKNKNSVDLETEATPGFGKYIV